VVFLEVSTELRFAFVLAGRLQQHAQQSLRRLLIGAWRRVYFVGLKDGQTVPTPSTVNFGSGHGRRPAGSDKENSGHHHLIIDAELPPLDQPIPSDLSSAFWAGQTEAEVTAGGRTHAATRARRQEPYSEYDPLISERIKVRVLPRDLLRKGSGPGRGSSAGGRHKSPPGAKGISSIRPTALVTPTPSFVSA